MAVGLTCSCGGRSCNSARVNLLVGWVEIGFIGWILMWSVFKWIKLCCIIAGNGAGRSGFYVNAGRNGLGWVEMDTLCRIV
jgi:hypothetical protein